MIPILQETEDLQRILSRSQLTIEEVNRAVKQIIEDVRQKGDEALFAYTEKFDGAVLTPQTVKVTDAEIEQAYMQVSQDLLTALRSARQNILEYHKRQLRPDSIVTVDGKTTGYMMKPVERAGIYVPGGKAAYPSSVLMCALPAVVAGVDEIIMTTPAGKWLNPLTLVAAKECGVKAIYKVGGAQAIAAMAFGTQTIPKVNVISGPGNIYVATAKREVFGNVGIDMIAGPSEILIIADKTANPKFVAADMLSQAEHDELAVSLVITTDKTLANQIQAEAEKQLKLLPKQDIASKSLHTYGAIVLAQTVESAVSLANKIAPEHLELCVSEPQKYLPLIRNAGAVFLGHYSPEPLGDYFAGPNHVLPTSGTAHFFSALGVDNYMKRISVIGYEQTALQTAAPHIITLAETEGLQAHANAIKVRKGE